MVLVAPRFDGGVLHRCARLDQAQRDAAGVRPGRRGARAALRAVVGASDARPTNLPEPADSTPQPGRGVPPRLESRLTTTLGTGILGAHALLGGR